MLDSQKLGYEPFSLKVVTNYDNKLNSGVFGVGLSISPLNNSLETSLGYPDHGAVSRACGADALSVQLNHFMHVLVREPLYSL